MAEEYAMQIISTVNTQPADKKTFAFVHLIFFFVSIGIRVELHSVEFTQTIIMLPFRNVIPRPTFDRWTARATSTEEGLAIIHTVIHHKLF